MHGATIKIGAIYIYIYIYILTKGVVVCVKFSYQTNKKE